VVTFHPQGHVDERHHKVLRCNDTRKRENRICLNEDLKKRKDFFSWRKDNDAKVKCIWLTETRQGAAVKNKNF
jgi:hypothetical protein